MKLVMTAKEVAEALQLPVKRVYELALDGQIPCVRFGRQIRFSRRAIEALVDPQGAADDGSGEAGQVGRLAVLKGTRLPSGKGRDGR